MHEELQTLIALHRPEPTEIYSHDVRRLVRTASILDGSPHSRDDYHNSSVAAKHVLLRLIVVEFLARRAALHTMYGDDFEQSDIYKFWRPRAKKIILDMAFRGQKHDFYRAIVLEPLFGILFERDDFDA